MGSYTDFNSSEGIVHPVQADSIQAGPVEADSVQANPAQESPKLWSISWATGDRWWYRSRYVFWKKWQYMLID